jgi:Na+-transporting methylmalonyl-CoA/oxaloacetate decarboxylase gamma subunit
VHAITATLGLALFVLIGLAMVLALVILVLYEVRMITRLGGRIASFEEPAPRFFDDVTPRR